MTTPDLGDFGLARGGGLAMALVRWGTGVPVIHHGRLLRHPAKYGHAALCVGPSPYPGQVDIIEATPRGVLRRYVDIGHFDWSTGGPLDGQLTQSVRSAIVRTANGLIGHGYDWPNIAGFIARWAYSKAKGRDEDHPDDKVICSEAVVWCWRTAGVRGMLDGRAPGSISPNDLAAFLPQAPK